ncbi:hypothetical protein AB0395_45380 [Streptosporangium sp. NPDC051023]|uniref:hypothetical protein n=1 Tax=Streptosporangium sp. NPDC051023 TaxID=3155410 RepID=UPI00344EA969
MNEAFAEEYGYRPSADLEARLVGAALEDAVPLIVEQARRRTAEEIAAAITDRRCTFRACNACLCRREDARAALDAAAPRAPLASLDELRGEGVTEKDAEALRAHHSDQRDEAEEALEARQAALTRVVTLIRDLRPGYTPDEIAEAILGPGDYKPGAALAALADSFPGADG